MDHVLNKKGNCTRCGCTKGAMTHFAWKECEPIIFKPDVQRDVCYFVAGDRAGELCVGNMYPISWTRVLLTGKETLFMKESLIAKAAILRPGEWGVSEKKITTLSSNGLFDTTHYFDVGEFIVVNRG